MSAFSKCTLAYLRQFFFARSNIFSEKSVATRLLHRCAVSFVSNPVPQAHSKTSYSGRIRFFHHRAKLLICFSVDNICKNVIYTRNIIPKHSLPPLFQFSYFPATFKNPFFAFLSVSSDSS